ncbi:hypothetical protein WR25_10538 [Diploscapter pachys]|uniref:Uncharacterized protein n=1 Tax=Diploscapter pachys TaxID=2018661 RepID=A0A2A2LVE8_9BILA|nr:hypothetical protein WR25_10538 [Diploscapter pachys]
MPHVCSSRSGPAPSASVVSTGCSALLGASSIACSDYISQIACSEEQIPFVVELVVNLDCIRIPFGRSPTGCSRALSGKLAFLSINLLERAGMEHSGKNSHHSGNGNFGPTQAFEFRPAKEGTRSKSPGGVIGRLSNFARGKTRGSLHESSGGNNSAGNDKPKKAR